MILNLKWKYSAQNNQCHVNYYRFKRYSSGWFVFRTLEAITAQPLPVTRIPDQQLRLFLSHDDNNCGICHGFCNGPQMVSVLHEECMSYIHIKTTAFLLLAETRHSSFHIATYHIATIAVRKQRTDGDDFVWYYTILTLSVTGLLRYLIVLSLAITSE